MDEGFGHEDLFMEGEGDAGGASSAAAAAKKTKEKKPVATSCAVIPCEREKATGSNVCKWHRTFKDGILYQAEQDGGTVNKKAVSKQMANPQFLTEKAT